MVPSRVAGQLAQSTSSSGIYFQGDELSQSLVNSPFGSSSDSITGTRYSNQGSVSGDINCVQLNSVGSSGPSVGASSLVTDANSAFSGGPHLQRSASINTESYNRLPASPLSFTSNNISISGSSMMDGQSVTAQQIQKTQKQGNPSVTSLPQAQNSQVLLSMSGGRVPGSLIQDPNYFSQVQKKPRIDIKQEEILQQQVLQQLLRPDSMQMQNRNPQLHALFQQQRLRQQQQILQSMPPLQRAHLQQQQQQQQLQLRQQMQQQGIQSVNVLKRPNDSGVCARRLMQYLYHQRQRPPDNAIAYWRKFVAEYYSPRAKKRWCLSLYENVGQHALGVFPQAAMDAWQCDICNSKSGRGFEATFEVLPRLNEIKFGSGVIDELLFLDLPKEYRTATGIMVLEYAKAVQESVHEQLRVVREGHLRIVFAQDLKILSWEFCARRHEELLSRRLVAPQVNQLLQVAQKCHSTISESGGADGVSSQNLQTSGNMVQPAFRQLAKTLELQSLNDLGFSKRYVRCLQISEVVNSMKDLIDFCRDTKSGPIGGLKNYPRHTSTGKLQMQEMEQQLSNGQGQDIPTGRTSLDKLMAVNHHNTVGNNHIVNRGGALSGTPPPQAALALTSYQNLLMRQNSMNSNPTNSTPSPSSSLQKPTGQMSSGYSSSPLLLQQQQCGATNNPSGALQHQMLQQIFPEMSSNGSSSSSRGGAGTGTGHPQQSVSGHAMDNGIMPLRNMVGFGNNSPQQPSTSNVSGGGGAVSRNNSFKAAAGGTDGYNPRSHDLPQHDILSDIAQELTDSGFFSGDFDDMGFNWKS